MKAGWELLLGGAVPWSGEEKPAWVLLPALWLCAFELQAVCLVPAVKESCSCEGHPRKHLAVT